MKTTFRFSSTAPRIALTFAAIASLVASLSASVLKEARISQVIKDVKVLPGQAAPRPASVNDNIREGTAVRTGADSRAELTFTDLTIARLGANTIFSFNEGTRTIDLNSGAILLRVPKGSGGAKVKTAAVTAAITGTTVMVEYHHDAYAKYIVLEGTMRIFLQGRLGESVLMSSGQMMIVNPKATTLPDPVDVDLDRLLKTSLLVKDLPPLGSETLLADAKRVQFEKKASGELIDTNLVIFGRGTLVTLVDPTSLDVIDQKTAASLAPTVPPPPPPTPTSTPPPPTPTSTPAPTPTPTSTPPPTPSPSPSGSPSKFGTPPVITSSIPYTIDNNTQIQTDPAITKNGVTDIGKIYRDTTQDGPFSAWAFTATSPFDITSGIDNQYGPNVPVAAFKFAVLQLAGDPIISAVNNGANNLALISVGPLSSAPAGNTVFTFAGMQSVLIATQNGSIDLSGISFQNIPSLYFYARGAGSNLTLGSPISNVGTLRLVSEGNTQIDAAENLGNTTAGGMLTGTAGGNVTVNALIDATGAGPTPGVIFGGAGGSVSLTSIGGSITVNAPIQVSLNNSEFFVNTTGGSINLHTDLASGTGITVASDLLSLGGTPAGVISLTTAGSDIIGNGAQIIAQEGGINISQSAAPAVGAAQITFNGGAILSDILVISSKGNINLGTTAPVNLFAVTLSLLAQNDLNWEGGSNDASASRSSGNVLLQAGNDINIINGLSLERSNGGITNGLNVTVTAGRNLGINQGFSIRTDGSGLTSGGNIMVTAGTAMTVGGIFDLQSGPTSNDQGSGSNITVTSNGTMTFGDLTATVSVGDGPTLGNGGIISVNSVGPVMSTISEGGMTLEINNTSAGIIGTGGNINLQLGSDVGGLFHLDLLVLNSGGTIQTGGNILTTIGGNLTSLGLNAQIDNRNGTIGNGASINFGVTGMMSISGSASFTILNSDLGSPPGTIGSDAVISVNAANVNIGGNLDAYIDNSDGSIGGTGGRVILQISGALVVGGRVNVFGTLNTTGAIMAGTLSGTNVTTPAAIQVGSGGITRFTFPNDLPPDVLHTITAGSLKSTGGINFDGPDVDNPFGFGPFDGARLTINVPSLTIGPTATDDIQGSVTFNGGAGDATRLAGNGGIFTLNTTGIITVDSPIEATTGLRETTLAPSGNGGTVNLNSTGDAITVNSRIQVSSAEPTATPGMPRRLSAKGGNINITSNRAAGVAIRVGNSAQLLSLLDAAAPGPGGRITILATGASSNIDLNGNLNGPVGITPPPNIVADRGMIDIRHTGDAGQISINNAGLRADVIKVGALGANGTLSVGGGSLNADSVLKLYAPGSNGSLNFIANCVLTGGTSTILAAHSVTIFNNVVVTIGGQRAADVYVGFGATGIANANYTGFGGNGTTTGTFAGAGATNPQPLANAPPFDAPGGR
jgi:mannose-6-phosphate isomerase-like protein (cupin superfamily)